jgi:DNA primase
LSPTVPATVQQIVDTYGRKVKAKRDGWLMLCLYPEHASDSAPSFSVRLDGVFYCWGCQRKGNLATLLHDIAGYSWKRAIDAARDVEHCAPLPSLDDLLIERKKTVNPVISKGLLGLYDVDWEDGYQQYIERRADGETQFPPWCFPFQKGFKPSTLKRFGAGYDTSYKRVTIPVYNTQGYLVGFTGRTCIGDGQKYMVYPPMSPSLYVYNLHRTVGYSGPVVLVEGPWDVWALRQINPEIRAVAMMTSHATEAQQEALADAHRHYIMLFDVDMAGKKGAHKIASALLDRGCQIDIARSSRVDIKTLTSSELEVTLAKRKPFPSVSAYALLGV